MAQEIVFIPLGGGQSVGRSCYYLRIGNANVILDAGIGVRNGLEQEPDFRFLITSPLMESMNQINQIFISHAHIDHVGYLLKLMNQASFAGVYMTEATKILTRYQLYNRCFIGGSQPQEDMRLAAERLFEEVASVSYLQTIDFKNYKATFYPAGHIPGAMMVLFEIGKRKILYTGDYSLQDTALTQGCMIPEGMDIDVVILCGLHAKHSEYIKQHDDMFRQMQSLFRYVAERGRSVMCHVPQLSKGVEFLKLLNEWNSAGIPIYLDDSVMNMVVQMERMSIPILTRYNRIMEADMPLEPHIYMTSERSSRWRYAYSRTMMADFSLHEDFAEMKTFLKKINPKQAVIVHCDKERSPFDHTIEQELMFDGDCRTQIIFAEEGEIYKI
ncbi:MAG: MBL fold metallo-hydrolase [Selenomonadales bacterium]|nr:MBL fold metallo-hydrolase [Selenomonadales bacterium]